MRRLHLLILATLRVCAAKPRGFSIQEDVLAFPQFEVVFTDSVISEKEAQLLLDSADSHPTYSAEFSVPTAAEATSEEPEASEPPDGIVQAYEIVNLAPHRYLCSIPVIQPPQPENETASELAKAQEDKELTRAAASGWGLVAQPENGCLYFMSGWWSYSFCNNREIVQYHAIASSTRGQPPRRDPHSADYVLGKKLTTPSRAAQLGSGQHSQEGAVPAELQVNGEQRYLVQKLEGGTICDLTGRERTIEVQYHCVPGMKGDKISWIKEVTICAYVMVVNTGRLCEDVAFLPPDAKKANPISCQLIADTKPSTLPLIDQKVTRLEPQETAEQDANGQEQPFGASDPKAVNVGGVIVGARNVISGADEAGKPPVKLTPPRSNFLTGFASDDAKVVEIIAIAASKEQGGKLEVVDDATMERLNLEPKTVRKMMEHMRTLSADAGWRIEMVETGPNGVRELRAYIDEEETADTSGKKGAAKEGTEKGKAKDGDDQGSEEKFFKKKL